MWSRCWNHPRSFLSSSTVSLAARSKNPLLSGIAKRRCGFVAAVDDIWTTNSTTTTSSGIPLLINESTLDQTTAKLYHRGPDGRHTARGSIFTSSTAQWSMGHQRLAIVDPTNAQADMPFVLTFGDTTVRLVANGEIYNHEAVYEQLVQDHGWTFARQSHSDCEVIAHACACVGPEQATRMLDGMFAFTVLLVEQPASAQGQPTARLFCARDSVGIKPLYYGTTSNGQAHVFASELKALVGHVQADTVTALPAGHYWSPDQGLQRYYEPAWLLDDSYQPAKPQPTDDELRTAFSKAIQKRMMADVDYGFFLSGGVDSCIVSHALMPLYRQATGDDRPIPCFTVGMEDSPDLMAAQAMVQALGGSKHVDHRPRIFTGAEVFDLIPKIIYHMETYEAELIRSSIPNWLLAERAGADVKMVLTGEGADELFAGYLYFMDATTPNQVQTELKRIYAKLGDINLHRTDRMTMAHGLEARVPFLDTAFTALAMSVDPARKMVHREAVANNAPGREKTMLRQLFQEPNANGHSIPSAVLWRAKAMQCEGVGEDWVSQLQTKVSSLVSDAELEQAATTYPLNPPQTKEEVYYRKLFHDFYPDMSHVVNPWEGGCRAGGAAWESQAYTRTGLGNTSLLTHAFQKKSSTPAAAFSTWTQSTTDATNSTTTKRSFSTRAALHRPTTRTAVDPHRNRRSFFTAAPSPMDASHLSRDEAIQQALDCGYTPLEATLTAGGDDRCRIHATTKTNKYHIRPQPVADHAIFRGSCTCNAPTKRGYQAANQLLNRILRLDDHDVTNEDSNQMLVDPDTASSEVSHASVAHELGLIFEEQRTRLAQALELPAGTEIVLVPSGSDAEYVPLVIARTLFPQASQNIVNVVTQLHEIGAGSSPAAKGEYFSTHAPLRGQLDATSSKTLQGFGDSPELNVQRIEIPARDPSGTPVDAHQVTMQHMQEHANNNKDENTTTWIVHGVFGGKTGLCDAVMPGSTLDEEHGPVLGVVDACQGRFSLEELHSWLEQESLVLFTGSKFYQAPPFCGAVVIPKGMASKLRKVNMAPWEAETMLSPFGLGGFVTDKELPDCLSCWKPLLIRSYDDDADADHMYQSNNVGLALRWEAGLAELEHLRAVAPDDQVRQDAISTWATAVTGLIAKQEPWLQAWAINGSIISIRLHRPNGNSSKDEWLNMSELRTVYRYMSLDLSPYASLSSNDDDTTALNEVLRAPVNLGQPVNVAESHAIVRIALGCDALSQYLQESSRVVAQDAVAVQKLAWVAQHFAQLQEAEQQQQQQDETAA